MTDLQQAVESIVTRRATVPRQRAVLVAVSGIDGSGKGYVTEQVLTQLGKRGVRVVGINIDGWLHLPARRFSRERPAENFYEHGIRFQELFEQLVLPLRDRRSHRVEADQADATNTDRYHRHVYDFEDVDIIILEGIFLLKRVLRHHYDLTAWIDCTFETALERALRRGQEGLSAEETVRDYERIYFAAQRIHLARDDPRRDADFVIRNDPALEMKQGSCQ